MLLVSESVAKRLVRMDEAITTVENVFRAAHRGEAAVFPVTIANGSDPATSFSMKSGVIRSSGVAGLKVGTYWPSNSERGIPRHGSTTLLLDDTTGLPRALVSASHLTALRTAGADGAAVKALAREDSRTVAVIGAGHQAWYELLAVREVRAINRVNVWSRTKASADKYADRVRSELGLNANSLPIEEAVRDADIIVTATTSRAPLVFRDWVRPGTHISAMGADSRGKQELDVALAAICRLFADVVAQSISIGELEAAVAAGAVQPDSITTLGAVLCGEAPGRLTRDDITLFDSSGMALQDLAIGEMALQAAIKASLAIEIDFR